MMLLLIQTNFFLRYAYPTATFLLHRSLRFSYATQVAPTARNIGNEGKSAQKTLEFGSDDFPALGGLRRAQVADRAY